MKKNHKCRSVQILLLILSCISSTSFAQERTHEGFYLSAHMGPAFGYVNGKGEYNGNQDISLKVSGTGFGFDILIGGAIKENLILYGTFGIKSILGPEIDNGFDIVKISQDYSFDEILMGVGSTYYLRNDCFFSGIVGFGQFLFSDESTNTTVNTDYGFSASVRAGKEWWISSRWALGAAIEYGGTYTKDSTNDYEERWQSHRYSIRLTATLNGRKN